MESISEEGNKASANSGDCKTMVYQRLHGGRTVVSIRCKPEIKEALKRFCKAKGLSICHVFEGLVAGFLLGVKEKIELVNQSPTINLTLVRDVKRVRRYALEEFEVCGFRGCKNPAVAKGFWRGKEELPLCKTHLREAENRPKDWRILQHE